MSVDYPCTSRLPDTCQLDIVSYIPFVDYLADYRRLNVGLNVGINVGLNVGLNVGNLLKD